MRRVGCTGLADESPPRRPSKRPDEAVADPARILDGLIVCEVA